MTYNQIDEFRWRYKHTFKITHPPVLDLVFWSIRELKDTEWGLWKEFGPLIGKGSANEPTIINGCRLVFKEPQAYEDAVWIERALVSADRKVVHHREKTIETVPFGNLPCLIEEVNGFCTGINLAGQNVCFRERLPEQEKYSYWDSLGYDGRLPEGMENVFSN